MSDDSAYLLVLVPKLIPKPRIISQGCLPFLHEFVWRFVLAVQRTWSQSRRQLLPNPTCHKIPPFSSSARYLLVCLDELLPREFARCCHEYVVNIFNTEPNIHMNPQSSNFTHLVALCKFIQPIMTKTSISASSASPHLWDERCSWMLSLVVEYIIQELITAALEDTKLHNTSAIVRPGHLISSILRDEDLDALIHSIDMGPLTFPSIDDFSVPFYDARAAVRQLDHKYSWYHKEGPQKPSEYLSRPNLYDAHLQAYLGGEAGDPRYFQRLHIRPVRFVGSYLRYDGVTDDWKPMTYADFDIIDAAGGDWCYRVCHRPHEDGTRASGYVYDRFRCTRVAEIYCSLESKVIVTWRAPDCYGSKYQVWGHLEHLSDDMHLCLFGSSSDVPVGRDVSSNGTTHEADHVHTAPVPKKQKQSQENVSITTNQKQLELQKLIAIAAHQLTYLDGYTAHPALWTSNHPMHIRISFQVQALLHIHSEPATLASISHSASSCSISSPPVSDVACSSLSRLLAIGDLLSIIAAYAPADLPYLPGISDDLPKHDKIVKRLLSSAAPKEQLIEQQ